MGNEKKNATSSDALLARIQGNSSQTLDFVGWIFDGLIIHDNSNIVEFCCGTGKQTLEFVKRYAPSSNIYAFDIEQSSIDHLESQIEESLKKNTTCRCLDFNNFKKVKENLPESIDVFFCSYGLYYNNHALEFLTLIKSRLTENGQIIIVGPYGKNNGELYDLLNECDVTIDEHILYTSQRFMIEIIDWMTDHFKDMEIKTERNFIAWDSADKVFSYWKNSTFYNADLQDTVKKRLDKHFKLHTEFINSKFIMKAKAKTFLP